jgi:hypothetical protein
LGSLAALMLAARPPEDVIDRVKVLDRAALLLKLAARTLWAGSEKAAAVTLREALELLQQYEDSG